MKKSGFTNMKKYATISLCCKGFLQLFIRKTRGRREYMCGPHYREFPVGNKSRAERDVYGADGRWLQRGVAEKISRLRRDRLL